jgi:hypothetical protein
VDGRYVGPGETEDTVLVMLKGAKSPRVLDRDLVSSAKE